MASELRVNTLKDASGNNSVGMAYVAGGSAKAFSDARYSGTPQDDKSFNISSLGDFAAGKIDHNFTSSMDGGSFSCGTSNRYYNLSHIRSIETTSSRVRTSAYDSADVDHDRSINVFGDLA